MSHYYRSCPDCGEAFNYSLHGEAGLIRYLKDVPDNVEEIERKKARNRHRGSGENKRRKAEDSSSEASRGDSALRGGVGSDSGADPVAGTSSSSGSTGPTVTTLPSGRTVEREGEHTYLRDVPWRAPPSS